MKLYTDLKEKIRRKNILLFDSHASFLFDQITFSLSYEVEEREQSETVRVCAVWQDGHKRHHVVHNQLTINRKNGGQNTRQTVVS